MTVSEYAMTEKRLLKICETRKMYRTPELNDTCYFHCLGFQKIEQVMQLYSSCKTLWMQSNGLDKIENLESLPLICLYLQENAFMKMENLNIPTLKQLNLSNNQIKSVEGLENCQLLESLYVANNRIDSSEGLKGLIGLQHLDVLDVAKNQINDENFIDIISTLPELKVLVMTGNPITHKMQNYRKRIIIACKKLTYLDERPVFEDERRCANAYLMGGAEAEQHEHLKVLCEKRADDYARYIGMRAHLDGKSREEAIRLSQEARQAVVQNFEKTGQLDLNEDKANVNVMNYKNPRRIWKDEVVETVSREFFEGRVTIRIGVEADEPSQPSENVPDLEYVQEVDIKQTLNEAQPKELEKQPEQDLKQPEQVQKDSKTEEQLQDKAIQSAVAKQQTVELIPGCDISLPKILVEDEENMQKLEEKEIKLPDICDDKQGKIEIPIQFELKKDQEEEQKATEIESKQVVNEQVKELKNEGKVEEVQQPVAQEKPLEKPEADTDSDSEPD